MTASSVLAAQAIEGVLWIGALVVALYWPWQKLCVDYARDIVFEQRDRLFDLAASGKIGFESAPYERVRTSMNAMIRLAHSFTIPRMLSCIYIMKRSADWPVREELRDVINQIEDPEVRDNFSDALQSAESAIVFMMLLRSPLTILIGISLIFVRQLYALRRKVERFIARPLEAAIGHEAQEAVH